jgi:cyanophycinase
MAGRIALIGGNEFRENCVPMDQALLAWLGGKPRVVIIPTAAAQENPVLAGENGVRYFTSLGARAEAAMVIDVETAREPGRVARIQKADLVYFTGGNPSFLLETIRGSAAWEAAWEVYQNGRMLAGSSAGAMILGGMMWAPGEGWQEGLGILPQIAVIPHHASLSIHWNVRHMRASLPQSLTLLGIDEATALAGPPWQVLGAGEVALYHASQPSIYTRGQEVPLKTAEP